MGEGTDIATQGGLFVTAGTALAVPEQPTTWSWAVLVLIAGLVVGCLIGVLAGAMSRRPRRRYRARCATGVDRSAVLQPPMTESDVSPESAAAPG